ncbi:4Fe-4S binding protein [Parvibacter caecicola]|uniref:Ferredoxin-type protein NapH n=1 Tax=Parvibacter caecicola TaxID=747645 RepID=A0A7W5GQ01_9ACTN|nr:4Fe-4S binding protein [Parvibacter caecicola]MBB3170658.1 ferredoxin-type protein NapH [Parvibacter caecicola]MCR2041382.1 4Fe-4S binding protein [Parvibacter caecicola]RNL11969.1 4Fe-4S ferredoxin [Parvibacter caecicola]
MANAEKEPRKKMRTSTLRALTAASVFVVVGIGLAFATGTGTLSAIGWNSVAAICPLGALESMLGAKTIAVRALIALVGFVIIALLVGKAFCSWVCPVPHLQNIFKSRKDKQNEAQARSKAADRSLKRWERGESVIHEPIDSRHAVLGGALLSTAIFGFPVFCLVCPVGLIFATFILFWRLVQFNEPTIGLIVFPAILITELLVFKRWCGAICPLGALMSLVSKANKTLRPQVDIETCLHSKGSSCKACISACPERIDPINNLGDRSLNECIRCKSCSDVCPVGAITFPLFAKNGGKEGTKE